MNRMTILWMQVSLFPQLLLPLLKEPMDKMAMAAGKEVMHGTSSMDFHSPGPIWMQLLLIITIYPKPKKQYFKMPHP